VVVALVLPPLALMLQEQQQALAVLVVAVAVVRAVTPKVAMESFIFSTRMDSL
jgi:hypothetical protein